MKKGKKLVVLGLLLTYMCMAAACTRNDKKNDNPGSMAGNTTQHESGTAASGTNQHNTNTAETNNGTTDGTAVTDTTDTAAGNAGTAGTDNNGSLLDDAGNAVGNIVDDAANGVSDITNDLVGNGNADNHTAPANGTTGATATP